MKISQWSTKKKVVVLLIVVAVLVLIQVAVAVNIAVNTYKRATEFHSVLQIENQVLSGTTLTVYIRNTSSTTIVLHAEYKNHALVASDMNTTLPPDTITPVTLSGNYAAGDNVVLMTKDGMMKAFTVM